ncbi:integrin alpha-9-like, partial [Grammomys surdaster]|uniref:integrin alpha-9-like n=1 Tax=Grammomys surdaster TaxID=491861 RepID=UPI00109F90BA
MPAESSFNNVPRAFLSLVVDSVSQEKGNCSLQRNPTPCIIPQEQENIFHTIFAFFSKSGRKVLDCENPRSFCLTLHCNLSALPKEESRTIDLYMLLNTEILKKDSSSVIQFMARAKVKVEPALRVVEIANGNPEETLPAEDDSVHEGSAIPQSVQGWLSGLTALHVEKLPRMKLKASASQFLWQIKYL